MKLTCIGHSGFALSTGEVTVIFDYYIDPCRIVDRILADARRVRVVVSHSHRDHLNRDIFGWSACHSDLHYIIANECRRKLARSINLAALPVTFLHHDEDYTDPWLSIHAFDSTDAGLCYLAHIGGKLVFHAGDFTCWHFSDDQPENVARKAIGDFHAILSRIAAYAPHIHLAMMPVVPNIGGDWAYGPRQLLRAVRVDTFVPMHTWGRDREATDWKRYRNPDHGECRFLRPGESLELTSGTTIAAPNGNL